METVSIIIPVYNADKYIERCVKSILLQTYQDYELLLVNDCSTDNTLAICNALAHEDSRIRVIDLPKNAGVSNARNRGIQEAAGSCLVFVDSDDWLHEDFLQIMMDCMIQGEYDMVCSSHMNKTATDETPDYLEKQATQLTGRQAIVGLFQNRYVQPAVWCKVFRKEIIDEHQLRFDTNITISEDIKFVYEYLTFSNHCYVINRSLYWYVIDNMDSAMNASRKNKSFQKKWLSAWVAYELMTEHTEKYFAEDAEVKRAFYAAKTCTARMKLHLMQEFDYKDRKIYKSMRHTIRKNIVTYMKYDYSDMKRKCMMALCSISPKLEYAVWRYLSK